MASLMPHCISLALLSFASASFPGSSADVCTDSLSMLQTSTLLSQSHIHDLDVADHITAEHSETDRNTGILQDTTFLMYYIHLPHSTKAPSSYYAESMEEQCTALKRLRSEQSSIDAAVVGSTQWLQKNTESCKSLVREWPTAGPPQVANDEEGLLFQKEVESLWANCSLKCDHSPKKPGTSAEHPDFSKLVRIWLNKLPVLCAEAEKRPDSVTVMVDAELHRRSIVLGAPIWQDALGASSVLKDGRLGIPRYWAYNQSSGQPSNSSLFSLKTWFGQPQCRWPPIVNAAFLAVRGRDCPKVMSAYVKSLQTTVADKTCGCFDEETVITRMLHDSPHLLDTRWTGYGLNMDLSNDQV